MSPRPLATSGNAFPIVHTSLVLVGTVVVGNFDTDHPLVIFNYLIVAVFLLDDCNDSGCAIGECDPQDVEKTLGGQPNLRGISTARRLILDVFGNCQVRVVHSQ